MIKLKTISRKSKIILALTAILVLGIAATFFYARKNHPLELHEIQTQWELRQGGVSTLDWGGWHVYVRDLDPKLAAKDRFCALLIHGLGDQATTWKKLLLNPADTWAKPVKFFAVDLPGSGKTPVPGQVRDYRARLLGAELTRRLFQNTPECSDWMLVGNSFGGMVATWMTIDHPEQIRRLALLAPGGLRRPPAGTELDFFKKPTEQTLLDFQKRVYFKPRPIPADVLKAAIRRMAASNSQAVLSAQTDEDFLESKLGGSHWKIPTWIIWGEADGLIPLSVGVEWHQKLPGSFLRTLPECGHLPHKECTQELIRFLNEPLIFGSM